MTRFDRLKDWPERLERMTEEELRTELRHWRQRERELGHPNAKADTAKRARTVESVIERRFRSVQSSGPPSLDELWDAYGHRSRPSNIGDRFGSVALGELDDEVQDVVGSLVGVPYVPRGAAARLELAHVTIVRVLPLLTPELTQRYFEHVAQLAEAALAEIAKREA